MTDVLFVYVVFASRREAEKVCKAAVKARLAACANVLGGCKSYFHWKGKLVEAKECPAVLKTTKKRFPALEKLIKKMHSYENPAIVAIEIGAGSKNFLEWVRNDCA